MNKQIKLTKIFTFEMAHVLENHDGDCKNIHGHSYKLHVTIKGTPLDDPGHPKHGMVMDFKQLKGMVKREILDQFDHALVLSDRTNKEIIKLVSKYYEKIIVSDYQPTAENLLLHFAQLIIPQLPTHVRLDRLKLFETERSYAEWENEA